ncbi:ABC transporter permease [Pseudoneobacillus rhizosphaerae]|uniref:D,D-dipeptide transport system permease protein DdpC n=1 Tax=Pseudoneobacillus rhizosphaerae TaxID=2880968 RepID=A0A9C7GCH5_9BACI|nr:ABC transporter permease subunit [Pseudoneobacillus rhizosphaerae]CAG9609934.1 putative D,D-dipeptide transport system permease protein DdpC [Pseudoneobacillus rhizosphaerae]
MNWNRQLIWGLIFVFILLFITIFGPYLPFIDSDLTKEGAIISKKDGKISLPPFAPSSEYWLGSDRNGVDMFSRLVMGAKDMLLLVCSITLIRYVFAIPLGFFAFYSRVIETLLNFLNLAFSFVPAIFMIILFINMPYLIYSPHRVIWVILIIAFLEVGRVAEILKQQVTMISQKPYIEAAITIGTRQSKLMKRYYFPVLFPELLVNIILDLGRTMFIIGQLGIIGIFISHKIQTISADTIPVFQIQNTSNAWPLLFETLLKDIFSAPWIPIATGIAISIVILGFFTLAEGLRKHFHKGIHYL